MNSKFIGIWTALAVLILGGLWFAGKQSAEQTASGAATATSVQQSPESAKKSILTSDSNFYDFGTISMANGLVMKEFRLANNSTTTLKLTNLYTSCMCTVANLLHADGTKVGPFGMRGMNSFAPTLSEVLPPKDSRVIQVVYNPAAHGPAGVGPIDRFVYIFDDQNGVATLEIKALVTP